MWLLKILKIPKSIFLEVDKIKPIHDFKDDNLCSSSKTKYDDILPEDYPLPSGQVSLIEGRKNL